MNPAALKQAAANSRDLASPAQSWATRLLAHPARRGKNGLSGYPANSAFLLTTFLALFLFNTPAHAQFQTPGTAGAAGGACTTGSYAWPDASGYALKCIASVWTIVTAAVAAAGSTGYVQFNTSNALNADSQFFWDNTNKRLGIGTTVPSTTLDVRGGIQSVTGGSTTAGLLAFGTNGNGVLQASSGSLLQINGASYTSVAINGNVGIGTTTPTQVLSLAASTPAIVFHETASGRAAIIGSTDGFNLYLTQPSGNIYVGSNQGAVSIGTSVNPGSALTINGGTTIGYNTTAAPFNGLLVSGNVGIGATSPNYKLSVSANATALPTSTVIGSVAQFASADATNTRILEDAFAAVPVLDFRRADTTAAAPSAVQASENMGQISWFGYGANAYSSSSRASTGGAAAENWSNTAQGMYLVFSTTATGAAASGERMRIDASGNVGIGSTSPAYKLDVNGTVNATNFIGSGTQITGITAGPAGSNTQVQYNNSGTMGGASGLVYVSGNVGIGTTSPNTSLTVFNTNQSTTLTNFTQALTNSGINIVSTYTTNAYTPGIFWSTADNNGTKPKSGIWEQETGGGTYLNFGTSNNYATGITNQAIVIDPTGNVGIGTASPATKLEVAGPLKVWSSSGNLIYLADNTGTTKWVLYLFGNDLRFWDATNSADTMTIKAGGNVGIGTATPFAKLHVNGTGQFDSTVLVNGNGTILRFRDSSHGYIYDDTNFHIESAAAEPLHINANANGSVFITGGGGSVGIGTSSIGSTVKTSIGAASTALAPMHYSANTLPQFPTTLLNLSGSNAANATQMLIGVNLENASTTVGAYSPFITFSSKSSSTSYNPTYASIAGIYRGIGGDANWATGSLTFWTAPAANGPLEHMRIDGSGNVGIGTTVPRQVFDVRGTTVFSNGTIGAAFQHNGGVESILGIDPTLGATWNNIELRAGGGIQLYVHTSGKVGIGNASPNGKLDVSSTSGSDGIVFGHLNGDNTDSIQAYIDGQWSNRATYASGCCNTLYLQRDVGDVAIGVGATITNAGAVTATSFTGNGSGLTNLNASNLASGTVPTARLGSGTANSTTWLRGDQTWANVVPSCPMGETLVSNAANGVACSSHQLWKTVFITSGTSWTVPSDFNPSSNTAEVIGGGGGGCSATTGGCSGGGGGGYAMNSNLALTPGGSVTIQVGSGGGAGSAGGTTWFNGANCAASSACATGGTSGSILTVGSGGLYQTGSTGISGGNGGVSHSAATSGGGGGGGAAGPGASAASGSPSFGGSGAEVSTSFPGGGGGGGANGGGSPARGSGNVGGPGGVNKSASGAGAANGGAGSGGGGGGGNASTTGTNGGAGSQDTMWTQTSDSATAGSGSGGGGGGGSTASSTAGIGANGSLYGGGGGGGAGSAGAGDGTGGSGAQGIIVVRYLTYY